MKLACLARRSRCRVYAASGPVIDLCLDVRMPDIIGYIRYNINWNYGLLPQTWEDPTTANADVEGALGDNDPGT